MRRGGAWLLHQTQASAKKTNTYRGDTTRDVQSCMYVSEDFCFERITIIRGATIPLATMEPTPTTKDTKLHMDQIFSSLVLQHVLLRTTIAPDQRGHYNGRVRTRLHTKKESKRLPTRRFYNSDGQSHESMSPATGGISIG